MKGDSYYPKSPFFSDVQKAAESVADAKEIQPGQFFFQHCFYLLEGAQPTPSNWEPTLRGLDAGLIPASTVKGPFLRILACRWLKPDTFPVFFSLN